MFTKRAENVIKVLFINAFIFFISFFVSLLPIQLPQLLLIFIFSASSVCMALCLVYLIFE